jgi:hypothetical protein
VVVVAACEVVVIAVCDGNDDKDTVGNGILLLSTIAVGVAVVLVW